MLRTFATFGGLIVSVLADFGGLIVSVKQSLLDETLQFYVPEIKQQFSSFTIPGGSSNGVSYDDITLDNGDFSSAHISLLNGAGAKLDITSLSFKMEQTNFSAKKYGITCKGTIWGSLSGTDASGIASLGISNGAVKATVDSNIAWGTLSIDHHLSNDFCSFIEDIVELFIGDINKKIEDVVKSQIPSVLEQVFQQLLNEGLSTFGTQVELPEDVLFDYSAVDLDTQPNLATFEVLGQFKDKNNPNKPTNFTPNAMTLGFPIYEANAMISEFPVNTASEVYTAKGLLAYQAVVPHSIFDPDIIPGISCGADCSAFANFWVTLPPNATFYGSPNYYDLVEVNDAYVNLSYTSNNGSGAICLVEVDALLTATFNVSVKNGKDIVSVTMDKSKIAYDVVKSYVGIFDRIVLEAAMKFAVAEFCTLFNSLFPGIPLPVDITQGIKLSTVKTYQHLHTVDVGVNVSFPTLGKLRNANRHND